MIKKLRKKFMFVNMAFVITILLVVLVIFFTAYYRRSVRNTNMFMESELHRVMGDGNYFNVKIGNPNGQPDNDGPEDTQAKKSDWFADLMGGGGNGKGNGPGNFLPSVIFKVDSNGNILSTNERDLTIDDTTAKTLVSYAVSNSGGENGGYLKDYGLKYMSRTAEDGNTYIIFADNSYEKSSIRGFILGSILIFAVAFLLFLILSWFLSRWALAPVEKAWKQQSQFVADASHELKTPITVILANLDILNAHREDTVGKQSRWIENTKEEAERMKQLIQDLLFLAKSDANSVPVIMSEVNYSDCVTDRALNFESVAFEKKVELDSDIAPKVRIIGNEGQLKQLVTILIDNAVKYAGLNGKVMIKMSSANEKAVLSVQNTGEPIAENEIGHIFERFYRTDKSRVHKEGGYGLGLSIAENIVKSHHGTITCRSNAEEGTTFTVELPCLKSA